MIKYSITILISVLFFFCEKLAGQTHDLNFSAFKESQHLWLGSFEGTINPKQFEEIRASREDKLIFLKKNNSKLEEHTHWATLGKDYLKFEEDVLEFEENDLKYKILKLKEDSEKKTESIRNSIEEIQKQIDELNIALLNKELFESGHINIIENKIKELEAKQKKFRSKIDKDELETKLSHEIQRLEIALERKKSEFARARKSLILKNRFPATLKIIIPESNLRYDSQDLAHVDVRSGESIALLVNESEMFIDIPAEEISFDITSIKQLELTTVTPSGKPLSAKLDSNKTQQDTQDGSKAIVRFKVGKGDVAKAQEEQNLRVFCNLYQKFDTPLYMIPKEDLLSKSPSLLAESGWHGLVQKLFPGVSVVQVGATTIAVKK